MSALTLPEPLSTRYRPLRLLGQGGFGRVLLARDLELDREVAIKLMRPSSPEDQSRVQAEAEALARLEHPGVARIYDHGTWPEGAYLIMEAISGRSLEEARPPDPLATMLEVAEALEAVHAAGLLHRDIKPQNILREDSGRTVLVDFGLSIDPEGPRVTATGAVVGTPAYLPPEAFTSRQEGPAWDWYAWGLCLHALLEGELPNPVLRLAALSRGDPPPPLEFSRTPEGPATRAILACMPPDPADRVTSLAELRRAMVTREPPPVPARPLAAESAAIPRPPAPAGSRIVPGVAVLCLVFALLGVTRAGRSPPEAPPPSLPPTPSSADTAEATLDAALTRLGRGHRSPNGLFEIRNLAFEGPGERSPGLQREWADGRVVGRYRRVLEALEEYLEAAAPARAATYLTTAALPVLDHIGVDDRIVRGTLALPSKTNSAQGVSKEAALTSVRALRELQDRGQAIADGAPPRIRTPLRACFEYGGDAPDEVHIHLAAREAEARGEADPVRKVLVIRAIGNILDHTLMPGVRLRCEVTSEAIASLTRLLQDVPMSVLPGLRTRIEAQRLVGHYFLRQSCPGDLREDQIRAAGAALDRVEALLVREPVRASAPANFMFENLLNYSDMGGALLTERDPRAKALEDRISNLNDRTRRALGHTEPRLGWGVASFPTSLR